MNSYQPKKIEKKWQKEWEKHQIYKAKDFAKKKKWYSLIEFPYPSGAGLHVGHIRSFTAMDIISRKRRMEGYNVLYPIGWDAFGLPTENYAIKTGIAPDVATKTNTNNFRRQLKSLGFSFDWSREINTTDPKYYKWTQWLFLQFFKNGLAYKAEVPINWCPRCKIGLANEEVINGRCERCGAEVEQKLKSQWMLKITAYAEKLLAGLKTVDFLPEIKTQQINWIGKSEGSEIDFPIKNINIQIKIFTTRPDTLFGATYLVLAPEHKIVSELKKYISNKREVENYINQTLKKTEEERKSEGKIKTGVELKGITALNPANKKEIPIWIADYVLASYGTGAIMAVPAHDQRDFEFAKKFHLPIIEVIKKDGAELPYEGDGILINSNKFNGLNSLEAKKEITKFVGGKTTIKYHLRDWVFSRQRYWGEPIPIINCQKCGYVPVPEKELPVILPKIKNYQPTDDGESPLSKLSSWVNTKCPSCGGKAKRETDVMPNWAGSSWYFLRYADPHNNKQFASYKKLKYWLPVDWYNGGMEHVTLHLLYSRFWNLFFYDLGLVPFKEPYKKRTAQGMVLGEGGIKMSKSKGNVINPDIIVKNYGADTVRLYEMFMGPFNQAIAWDTKDIEGLKRFLLKVWNIAFTKKILKVKNENLETLINKTIKKVNDDIELMSFHTAISALMIFVNEVQKNEIIPQTVWEKFLIILAPFAPHITEELWFHLGHKKSIHLSSWPIYNEKELQKEKIYIIIQINGKFKDKILVKQNLNQKDIEKLSLQSPKIQKLLQNQSIKKIIFVPNKLINFLI
ncbi:MAG: leucine--tRNA ligase [Minisyncoccia bacterium]